MPTLSNSDAIKEYYESVKEKYPDLSFKHFEEICATPMRFVKMCMRGSDICCINIKYFGKFKVYASKIKKIISELNYKLEHQFIDREIYDQRMKTKLSQLKAILEDEFENEDEDAD